MGMTMTQKILARHAGLDSVRPGQLIQGQRSQEMLQKQDELWQMMRKLLSILERTG